MADHPHTTTFEVDMDAWLRRGPEEIEAECRETGRKIAEEIAGRLRDREEQFVEVFTGRLRNRR